MSGCALDLCDGTGLIEEPDFTGSVMVRCACRATREMPEEFADIAEQARRFTAEASPEAKASRGAVEALHAYLNRPGW